MTHKSDHDMIMQTICKAINSMGNSQENDVLIKSKKLCDYGFTHVDIGSVPNGRFNNQASFETKTQTACITSNTCQLFFGNLSSKRRLLQ